MPTSTLGVSEKKAIDKGTKAKVAAKEKEKMPGGKAEGMETVSFSQAEKKAIEKGAKIEDEEHGPLAPKEIAKDHVAESGSKYYSDTKGLPAMEKQLDKASPAKQPSFSEFAGGRPPAHGTVKGLAPAENLHFSKAHQKLALQHAATGNKESAMYHQKQAKLYWDSHKGIDAEHPVHEINVKSEKIQKATDPKEKDPDSDEVDHEAEMEKRERAYDEKMGKSDQPTGRRAADRWAAIKGHFGKKNVAKWQSPSEPPPPVKPEPTTPVKKGLRVGNPIQPQPVPVIKSDDLNKGALVSIKTGKKIPATKKRVENQPVGAPSGHPTPEVVGGKVSGDVAAKFDANRENKGFVDKLKQKTAGPGPSEADRVERIKASLGRINNLMGALKEMRNKGVDAPVKPANPLKVVKSIQYASGSLSKSINSDCDKCGSKQHKQWCDTAKSESCAKCGTPMSKSGSPEEMPDEVKNLSKASNSVRAGEADELKKFNKAGVASLKNAFGGGDTPPPPPPPPPPPSSGGGWFDKANDSIK